MCIDTESELDEQEDACRKACRLQMCRGVNRGGGSVEMQVVMAIAKYKVVREPSR